MSARGDLLASIATTISDYRAGEIAAPTPEHVDRWVKQFERGSQDTLLQEIDHVLKETYFSKKQITGFLTRLVTNSKLAGDEPCKFWRKTHFLAIQQHGESQKKMLALFDAALKSQCGLRISECGQEGGDYVYLDDAMFSGSRVGNDLAPWIEGTAPANVTVHVIVAAIHTGGAYLVGERLKKAIAASGKKVKIEYWRTVSLENQKYHRNNCEVLWPTALPDDPQLAAYLAKPHKFPFVARLPGGKLGPFSSEERRQLLEKEMLLAGVKIRALSKNPKEIIRPLGFSPFGLGFGSTIVTYRNCPNNCPLALWWGDPTATSGPFHWYPLLQRKTHAQSDTCGFGIEL